MNFAIVLRRLGLSLLGFAPFMLTPLVVAALHGEVRLFRPFIDAGAIVALAGLLAWFAARKAAGAMRLREGFLFITLFWCVLSLAATLPLLFTGALHLPFVSAFFEAVSGLTGTGATVITGLDALPRAILWYRAQLQWLGGFAVAVIALAALPVLNVGGMQLYRGDPLNPTRQDRILPRARDIARAFIIVYLLLTMACASAYWFAGMQPFDAIAHALTTVSTGGFSTHDSNLAWFQNDAVEMVAIFFMLAGGISFAVHLFALLRLDPGIYWKHAETRLFIVLVLWMSLLAAAYLLSHHHTASVFDVTLNAVFQVVSIMTTSGFRTEHYADWPGFLPVLLIFIGIMGACAGSAGGGMKVFRVALVWLQGLRELRLLVHPASEAPVKFAGRLANASVVEAVWGFFAAYTLLYTLLMLLFMSSGLDQVSAFSAVAATLNNLGPGLGEVASNFAAVPVAAKWVGIIAMILGRVEIFVVAVLFTAEFWRH